MGDPTSDDGFSAAFDTYAPLVLRFGQRRLDDPDAAWDVVTDTFTTAWRHWGQRPDPARLLPWLYAIAGNAVRDQRRSARRRTRLTARLSTVSRVGSAADPADEVVLGQSVASALARLPERDQELLRLVAWEGLTDARSIGLVLGLSPAAVRVGLHRARRRLRGVLDETDDPLAAAPGRPAPGRPAPGRPAAGRPALVPSALDRASEE